MYYIATITDRDNAVRVRRHLHKAGFTYRPALKLWVLPSMTIRGARLDLPTVRAIDGISWKRITQKDMCSLMNEAAGYTLFHA